MSIANDKENLSEVLRRMANELEDEISQDDGECIPDWAIKMNKILNSPH